jgi:hypothetical protein
MATSNQNTALRAALADALEKGASLLEKAAAMDTPAQTEQASSKVINVTQLRQLVRKDSHVTI